MGRIRAVLTTADPSIVELGIALYTACWALLMLFPPEQLLVSPSFVELRRAAPEWFWGVLAASAALPEFEGVRTGDLRTRRSAAVLTALHWCVVTGFVLLAWTWGPAILTYSSLCVGSLWVQWRLVHHG